MYAAWTTIATVLNLGSALIYREPHLKQQTSASLCLGTIRTSPLDLTVTSFLPDEWVQSDSHFAGILTLEIVIWVILDNIIFQRVTRYLFTPYAVLIWALVGSVDKNFEKDNPVSIFTGSLLVIAIGKKKLLATTASNQRCFFPKPYKGDERVSRRRQFSLQILTVRPLTQCLSFFASILPFDHWELGSLCLKFWIRTSR